jgi:hypothetical protein
MGTNGGAAGAGFSGSGLGGQGSPHSIGVGRWPVRKSSTAAANAASLGTSIHARHSVEAVPSANVTGLSSPVRVLLL